MQSIIKQKPQVGILLSLLCLLLLGLMPVISNSRPQQLSALNFALYLSLWQLIFAFPVTMLELKNFNRGIFNTTLPSQLKRRAISIIVLTGIIFGISTFVYVLSVEKAGTVSAAIAIQAYPLFAILWETTFLGKRKNKAELFFTLLLIIGLYYIATKGTWVIEGISLWFLLAMCVPLLWSIAHVIIRELLVNTPITPSQVTFFRVLISSLLLLLVVLVFGDRTTLLYEFSSFEFQQYALIMGLIYYFELMSWFYAVRHIDVSVASSITTPAPVLTMILAFIILNEPVELYQLMAIALIIISMYGIIYTGRIKNNG